MARFRNYYIRLFAQTLVFLCGLLGGCVILCGYLLGERNWLSYGELGTYLNISQSTGLFLFVLFAFLAFEFLYLERASGLTECLETNRQLHLQIRWNQILLLLPLALVPWGIVFGFDFFAVLSKGALTGQVLTHLILSSVLNVLVVEIIGILLGAVLASCASRPAAYCIMILFAFLMSPVAKNWVAVLLNSFETASFDPVRIMDFFGIVAMDTDWVPDPIYGLPIERCRWALALFWIALFLSLFLLLHRPKGKRRYPLMIGILWLAALLGLVGFLRMGGDSTVRLDDRRTGTAYGDYFYETTQEQKEESAAFSVLSYDLDLKITGRLHASATMTLTKNPEGDAYRFTLYRGYRILSVTDGEGNPLTYTRTGHYLEIDAPFDTPTGTILVEYEGSGGRYYSNDQGIALPGYLPWYPMPGYRSLWDEASSGISVSTEGEEIDFSVTVDTRLPLVCNLEEVEEHTYAGKATAVTLVGGLLTEKTSDGYVYYDSPLNLSSLDLETLEEELSVAEELLGISFDVDFSQKKIICMPRTICATSGGQNEGFVIYSDCILLDSEIALTYSALDQLIPQKTDAAELRELLILYLWSGGTMEEPMYYDSSLEGVLPSRAELAALEPESGATYEEIVEAQAVLERLLRCKMEAYGTETVLRQCYEYLCSQDTEGEVSFLYALS
jgi:hypothetical protein